MDQHFVRELMAIGIVSYREQETLWEIAKRCAKTVGVPMAGAGFVWGSKAGTFVPGAGTISAPVAGALAGLAAGTLMCWSLNTGLKEELKKLAEESRVAY